MAMLPISAPSLKTSVIAQIPLPGASSAESASGASVFKSILADSIQQVQNTRDFATRSVEQFLSGENQDLHEVAIASQKAEMNFDLFMQVRNKVVAAYQEVMRMQL
jgi:flagellar hook-basal body complex protein FliE